MNDEQLVVSSAPAFYPVSIAEMRRWCRIEEDDTNHDATLNLIRAALTKDAENRTMRAFVRRSYTLYMSCWPIHCGYTMFRLPFPPLISVESIKYRDLDGALQTLDSSQYDVHAWKEPGIVVPAWNVAWPSIRVVPDAIQVAFTAGYAPGSPDTGDEGAAQENVPANLKLWFSAKALTIFDKRDQLVIGTNLVQVPRDFTDGLIDDLIVGDRIA